MTASENKVRETKEGRDQLRPPVDNVKFRANMGRDGISDGGEAVL